MVCALLQRAEARGGEGAVVLEAWPAAVLPQLRRRAGVRLPTGRGAGFLQRPLYCITLAGPKPVVCERSRFLAENLY